MRDTAYQQYLFPLKIFALNDELYANLAERVIDIAPISRVLKAIARMSANWYFGQFVMQFGSISYGPLKEISQKALATTHNVKIIVPIMIRKNRDLLDGKGHAFKEEG